MVCEYLVWYQNFAYICSVIEAVASARGYVTRPSRHHCAWVTFRAGRLRLPCSFFLRVGFNHLVKSKCIATFAMVLH